MVILVRGYIGSGKTSFSKILKKYLENYNLSYLHIDGDIIRKIWGDNLGYSKKERNIVSNRIIDLIIFLNKQNVNILVSSLFVNTKKLKKFLDKIDYLSLYIDADIKLLIKKNKKNIYARSKNTPGLDLKYGPINKKCVVIKNNFKIGLKILVINFLNIHLKKIKTKSFKCLSLK